MPHIEGESLRERIVREKQLGGDDSVAITQKGAGSLYYAHGHGVVFSYLKAGDRIRTGDPQLGKHLGVNPEQQPPSLPYMLSPFR